ncbi:probable LRR receptor-like serine/threonine-protein kinase At3g47570 [Olea europaea var. sylvestris]|uniref:probable LRR receptor-like serine/threonine-protein kinase At3g47570 n=1 Tax=Olea europaea var. sylvestris TaxID=158386 RepID=UPI000C1D3977|nr:probable LRR receptor-like serine/threonine-protein kinase At3g47570 [Olea europaea var. sylvestris]
MEKLEYLVYFNVSFNELTGKIPNGGPFKNFTSSFFTGNGELCGASQFKVQSCKGDTTRLSSNTKFLKYILPSIAVVLSLAITMVYLIRRHNRNTLFLAQSTPPVTVKRISYYEVLNATNKFGEESLIGKGSIGSVYKGMFSDGMIAAIKVFNLDLEGINQTFYIECQMMCNIRLRNLVKEISSCSNLDLKALVLEYMHNGNLTKWLSSINYFLNLAQRLEIMIDVAFALEYLHYGHYSSIVHYFGIAKLFTKDQRITITKTLGTIGYMAPANLIPRSNVVEYGSAGLVSTMADVYSYGIMLMETFTKKKPTDDMFIVDVDLVNAVEDNIRAKESCFTLIMELALECMTDLPEERLNAKDVLARKLGYHSKDFKTLLASIVVLQCVVVVHSVSKTTPQLKAHDNIKMQAQKWAIQYFSNQYSGGDGKLGSAVSSPGDGVVESGSASSTQTTGPARPTYLELQVA